ncbi:MAG: exo-beta-N-acetylmuramidase NamZ family protein [Bacillota bacterium]
MKKYKTGLENFLENKLDPVHDKRVGLITNHTGLTTDLKINIDLFNENSAVKLMKIFGPEHGVRGNVGAGDKVSSRIDEKTGLQIISLYGKNKKLSGKHLSDLDTIIFDIQDIGVRFYTYVSTLLYTLESCGKNNKELIVLDRMNPLGRKVEGNILKDDFASFIGLYPLPHRHGMTFGEIAHWANEEFSLETELRVIKCSGWEGKSFSEYNDLFWIPPSPGIPHFETALSYPISCMLEGTNISEGRGTTKPFEYIGAPWVEPQKLATKLESKNLDGIRFRPVNFIPSFSKHQGKECGGIHLLIENEEILDSYLISLTIIKSLFDLYPKKTLWKKPKSKNCKYFFDLLMGTDEVRKKLDKKISVKNIVNSWQEDLENFKNIRNKYLLY